MRLLTGYAVANRDPGPLTTIYTFTAIVEDGSDQLGPTVQPCDESGG